MGLASLLYDPHVSDVQIQLLRAACYRAIVSMVPLMAGSYVHNNKHK